MANRVSKSEELDHRSSETVRQEMRTRSRKAKEVGRSAIKAVATEGQISAESIVKSGHEILLWAEDNRENPVFSRVAETLKILVMHGEDDSNGVPKGSSRRRLRLNNDSELSVTAQINKSGSLESFAVLSKRRTSNLVFLAVVSVPVGDGVLDTEDVTLITTAAPIVSHSTPSEFELAMQDAMRRSIPVQGNSDNIAAAGSQFHELLETANIG